MDIEAETVEGWGQKLLIAARSDIVALGQVEKLTARDFERMIRVSKFAENIATSWARGNRDLVLKETLAECEFLPFARNLHAAVVAHFANGDVTLYEKYRRLQNTHVQVEVSKKQFEAAHEHVLAEREHIQSERKAIEKLRESLQLSSGGMMPELPALPPASEVMGRVEEEDETP